MTEVAPRVAQAADVAMADVAAPVGLIGPPPVPAGVDSGFVVEWELPARAPGEGGPA